MVDDCGPAPVQDQERRDLLEILEDRYGTRSTIITSQLPPVQWRDYLGGATFGDAICDRLLHNAHRLVLNLDFRYGSMPSPWRRPPSGPSRRSARPRVPTRQRQSFWRPVGRGRPGVSGVGHSDRPVQRHPCSALWTLPGRSVAARQSPSWLKTKRGW
ncbi:MAG: ATP-binding protein [Candidatus Rokuibacteriota bacterium]